MNTLHEVWHEVEKLLDAGISVIPVRDKDDQYNVAKSPYSTWKQYQHRLIGKKELWFEMEKFNTCAVGTLGGKISGNLNIIDVDVKYKKGIDAILFKDIKTLYPNIYDVLRIHESPSGGYHILYRCEGEIEGNLKLAGRPATEAELLKSKQKIYNFIETRGEGGYVLAPPSLGYKIRKNCPIPVLTVEQHQSLIQLCRSYNEVIKIEKPAKLTTSQQAYYEENPFDDFNARVDPDTLMQELGWEQCKHSDRFIWYTRPGKKKGVSISFNLQKRFFYCFTASSELEADHGYTPCNLVATLLFNGDKKKLYSYLTAKGYGKVKPKIEQQQVKRLVLSGQKIPSNFSEAAKALAETEAETLQEKHPYGIFWEMDEDNKVKISREMIYAVADGLGLKRFEDETYRIIGNFVYEQTERDFIEVIKEYIFEDDPDIYEDICNAYEHFMQVSLDYTIKRIRLLNESLILKDTREKANKFFANCFLEITADSITTHAYSELGDRLVFFDRIQKREYSHYIGGDYIDFLKKATGKINDQLKKVVGYLTHEYKDETTAYIIVCVETCPDPKNGGGSGKNVFCDLMKYSTTYVSKPGSQSKMDEKFFQTWNGQRVFGISDLPENFDFAFLKELSSGTMVWKKLFKNETIVANDRAPKILTQTNFSYKVSDGGLKRRIIPVEFTEFFTLAGGLDVHYNKHFPLDWTAQDWNGYDTFIADSIQTWIKGHRKIKAAELSETGWEKQFIHEYTQTAHDLIVYYWDEWINAGKVYNEDFKMQLERYYFENSINHNFRPSVTKINKGIEAYAQKKGYVFVKDHVIFENNITKKVRLFGEKPPF